MKRREESLPLLMLLSYVCLVGSVLFLVTAGSRLFQQVTVQRSGNAQLRTTLYYLQNQVAANDVAGGVSVRQGPEGDLLALAAPETDSEVYVYAWKGSLVEELSPAGEEPHPELAETVAPVNSFSVELRDGMLEFQVDGHRAWMSLRCEGES